MSATAESIQEDQQIEDTGPKIGLFDDIPNDEYHRSNGVSKSGLDLIAQSPAHYIANKHHPRPSTPAFVIGSAFHCLVLEPEKFGDEYVLAPKNAPRRPTAAQLKDYVEGGKLTNAGRRSVEFWESWEQDSGGKTVLTGFKAGDDPFWQPGQWDQVHRMAESIQEHATARILLNLDDGKAEQSAWWVDKGTGKLCRCRPDFMNDAHKVIVDLKSTNDASYHGFSKSISDYRYFVQDAFYMDGLRAVGEFPTAFIFVAVEKLPPYGVGVYTLDREARYVGAAEYRRNLELYARCHKEGVWPAYPTNIRELNLTTWQLAAKVR